MPDWPSGLPQSPLVNGFSESTPDTRLRTQMDVGADKMRRRYTGGIRRYRYTMFFTKAQVAIFETFLQTTLNGGIDIFTWKNHRTDASADLRFIEMPTYTPIGGGDFYNVNLALEELP